MTDEPKETLDVLPPPVAAGKLTNQQILLGQRQDPADVITLYSDEEWEKFIKEWVESLRTRYKEVRRASGSDGQSTGDRRTGKGATRRLAKGATSGAAPGQHRRTQTALCLLGGALQERPR